MAIFGIGRDGQAIQEHFIEGFVAVVGVEDGFEGLEGDEVGVGEEGGVLVEGFIPGGGEVFGGGVGAEGATAAPEGPPGVVGDLGGGGGGGFAIEPGVVDGFGGGEGAGDLPILDEAGGERVLLVGGGIFSGAGVELGEALGETGPFGDGIGGREAAGAVAAPADGVLRGGEEVGRAKLRGGVLGEGEGTENDDGKDRAQDSHGFSRLMSRACIVKRAGERGNGRAAAELSLLAKGSMAGTLTG